MPTHTRVDPVELIGAAAAALEQVPGMTAEGISQFRADAYRLRRKLAAARSRRTQHLTFEECLQRYPRLVKTMQWVAILSSGEAACAIRDYRDGFKGREYGGEAVNHFGGPEAVIRAGIRSRHTVRWLRSLSR